MYANEDYTSDYESVIESFNESLSSEEWMASESKIDNIEMLQIESEVLNSISTSELLKVALDYPYISDIFYYEDYLTGFENKILEFNGLSELVSRKDFGRELVKLYEETDVMTEESIDISDLRLHQLIIHKKQIIQMLLF